jgi:WD40 repeat protein
MINSIIKPRTQIITYLNDFFPKDITKLIALYDYCIEGKYIDNVLNIVGDQCMSALPDGRIVVGSFGGQLTILKPQSIEVRILAGHSSWVTSIIVLPASDTYPSGRIIGGSYDGKIKIWNVQTEICEINFELINDYAIKFNILPDERIAIFSYDNIVKKYKIYIWNPFGSILHSKADDCNYVEKKHFINIYPPIFFDENMLVRIYNHHLARWNLIENKLDNFMDMDTFCDFRCGVVLFDKRIVIGTYSGNLYIWNTFMEYDNNTIRKTNKYDVILNGHDSDVTCLDILPDGRFVSGSKDKTLKIWNANTRKCDVTLLDPSDISRHAGIERITVLPDGRIVSQSTTGTIKIWS